MSLLREDEEDVVVEEKKSNKKQMVLMMLIISIFLLVITIVISSALPSNETIQLTLTIDNSNRDIVENLLVSDDQGITYISLSKLAPMIGYKYLQGGYLEFTEDATKCYLENDYQIIGFEANTNKIFKTKQDSQIEYQYYELGKNIMQSGADLYISLDDLNIGCNVVFNYSQDTNNINIETPTYIAQKHNETFKDSTEYSKVSEEFDNQKAVSYDMIVITDKSGKVGVVKGDFSTLISAKYSSMLFDEYTQNFIVSNNEKYGVISKQGKLIIELKYDSIKIIGYEPILYQVGYNNKYGVIDAEGNILIDLEYDSLGYPRNKLISANPTLIIKDVNKEGDGIVVKNDNRYGVVSLATGKIIGACELDAIYSKTDELGQNSYYIRLEDKEYTLKEYIDIRNTVEVNLSNN